MPRTVAPRARCPTSRSALPSATTPSCVAMRTCAACRSAHRDLCNQVTSPPAEREVGDMLFQLPEGARDYAVLVGRLLLGVVMFAYGWDKWVTRGLTATAAGLGRGGVPFPYLSAMYAGTVELLGGALLILGALTALVGVLMVLDMAGAIVTTHQYVSIIGRPGIALTGAILAGALVFAAIGAGRYSVDHLLDTRRRAARPGIA